VQNPRQSYFFELSGTLPLSESRHCWSTHYFCIFYAVLLNETKTRLIRSPSKSVRFELTPRITILYVEFYILPSNKYDYSMFLTFFTFSDMLKLKLKRNSTVNCWVPDTLEISLFSDGTTLIVGCTTVLLLLVIFEQAYA